MCQPLSWDCSHPGTVGVAHHFSSKVHIYRYLLAEAVFFVFPGPSQNMLRKARVIKSHSAAATTMGSLIQYRKAVGGCPRGIFSQKCFKSGWYIPICCCNHHGHLLVGAVHPSNCLGFCCAFLWSLPGTTTTAPGTAVVVVHSEKMVVGWFRKNFNVCLSCNSKQAVHTFFFFLHPNPQQREIERDSQHGTARRFHHVIDGCSTFIRACAKATTPPTIYIPHYYTGNNIPIIIFARSIDSSAQGALFLKKAELIINTLYCWVQVPSTLAAVSGCIPCSSSALLFKEKNKSITPTYRAHPPTHPLDNHTQRSSQKKKKMHKTTDWCDTTWYIRAKRQSTKKANKYQLKSVTIQDATYSSIHHCCIDHRSP